MEVQNGAILPLSGDLNREHWHATEGVLRDDNVVRERFGCQQLMKQHALLRNVAAKVKGRVAHKSIDELALLL
jgi:hypothetical protein